MKTNKFEKSLMLKKVTIADLNREQLRSVLGGVSSCPCVPSPSDLCDQVPSEGGSCVPDANA